MSFRRSAAHHSLHVPPLFEILADLGVDFEQDFDQMKHTQNSRCRYYLLGSQVVLQHCNV